MIKPQFEVGPAGVGKGGVVRDRNVAEQAVRDVHAWFDTRPGWQASDPIPSPILGSDGNREFLIAADRL
ncbi:MAG: SAM-dependent methyltransferase [Pseudomonadota bacterium]